MYCDKCGAQIPVGGRFCQRCGNMVFTVGEMNIPMTEELRSQVYDDLMTTGLSAVEKGIIHLVEVQQSAQYMLDHLDGVNTYYSLIDFLMAISHKWSIYKPVLEKHFDPKKLTDSQKLLLVAENMKRSA